jgi:hypothetical protein
MATVAVLLCLVLISTSIVSGVFARFAITKKAETTVKLEQFGVTIELTPDANLVKETEIKKGDSATVEFSNLQMVPGDSFYNALNVKVTGAPTVDVVLRITCHIDYDTSAYKVDNIIYMPLGYTIHFGNVDQRKDVCYPYQEKQTSDAIEEIIVRNIYNNLFNKNYTKTDKPANLFNLNGSSDYYFEKEYKSGNTGTGVLLSTDKVRDFYLGFDFPDFKRSGSGKPTNVDEIATALSENAANSSITIQYSFAIEQK